jgi:hypothetical protein
MKSLPIPHRARSVRKQSVIVASVIAAAALAGCHPVAGHDASPGHETRATLAAPGTAAGSTSAAATPSASRTKSRPSTSPSASPSASTSTSPAPSSSTTGSTSPATGTATASGPASAPATATASPTASASTSAPAQSGGAACVQTTNARCSFSSFPGITGASSTPWVDQNIWAGSSTYKQTLHATNPGNWYVVANANTHFGGVLTYPNTGFDMTGPVDSYSSVTSSFNASIPTNAQTAGWAAYDLWFNNWADEVMIQTDITANSDYDCTAKTSATIDGAPWHLCVFGSERVWKPGTDDQHMRNTTSGTINIQAFLTWMEQNGDLPAASTWTAGSYGFEICDTGGANETFQLNSFSWSAQK